jgi:hypothetical protein
MRMAWQRRGAAGLLAIVLLGGCQKLDQFDTKGTAAYCGPIVIGQFVRTPEQLGGFNRDIRLRVDVDMDAATTSPATITSDDAADGQCAPRATFAGAKLRVTPEVVSDPLSTLTFEEGQVHNFVGWVDSTCRGSMLSVVSLYKNDRVEVRFLWPSPTGAPATSATGDAGAPPAQPRDGFALFTLKRYEQGCGY